MKAEILAKLMDEETVVTAGGGGLGIFFLLPVVYGAGGLLSFETRSMTESSLGLE